MELKDRLLYIAKHYGLSVRSFETECSLLRGNISNMKGAIGSDKLAKIIDRFSDINIYWLLSGVGSPFITGDGNKEKTKTTENVPKHFGDNFGDNFGGTPKLRKLSPNMEGEEKTKTTENVTIEKSNIPNLHKTLPNELPKIALQSPTLDTLLLVPIVDVSAAAGGGCLNTDYIDQTNIISLPRQLFKKKTGQRYCIKIVGHSMYPTLAPGSYIIIRHLDRGEWGYIKDDRIYVITDTEGKTVVKRVLNDLYDCGQLRCISDNPDKAQYFDFAIPENEISNVFEVELYLTSDLNANMAIKQMTDQAEMAEMKMSIQELQKAIIEIQKKL